MRKIITTLAAVATVAALGPMGASPAAAQAQDCRSWWLSKHYIIQGGFSFRLPAQNGPTLKGTVRLNNGMLGTVRGTVYGSTFRLGVTWENGTKGDYTGTLNADGFLQGTARDRVRGNTQGFFMSGMARCVY